MRRIRSTDFRMKRARSTNLVLFALAALAALRWSSQCAHAPARADHAPAPVPSSTRAPSNDSKGKEPPAPSAPSGAPVERIAEGGPSAPAERAAEGGPSDSLQGCLTALALENAKPAAARGPRLATFNVKWFPDLGPGKKLPKHPGTDVEWLACLIALTRAEAVAVQEFKRIPRARQAAGQLLGHLDRMTGGAWDLAFDNCPNEATQHVGILNDQKRSSSDWSHRTLAELNPHGEACKDSLRPGLAADLTLSDGTKVTFVSVHLKSGTEVRSRGLRQKSFDALVNLAPAPDHLLVVAGDLNSMGCPTCTPSLDASAERTEMQRAARERGLDLPAVDPPCSHHFERGSTLLDGFVVSDALAVAGVHASGHCQAAHCSSARRALPVERAVSDHCPVVLELAARAPRAAPPR